MKHFPFFLIAATALIFSSASAHAQCSSQRLTVADELHASGETVVATVQGAQNAPDTADRAAGVNYYVKIDRVLHGKMLRTDNATIFSEDSAAKFPMQVGKQYLLFVHENAGRLSVDNCGNSGLLSASAIENGTQLKNYAKNN